MNFLKVIFAHERPSHLKNILQIYADIQLQGDLNFPSTLHPNHLLVIDSSCEKTNLPNSINGINIEYVHLPALPFQDKLLFLSGIVSSSDEYQWIDFCTDQDLFFRSIPHSIESDIDFFFTSAFAWSYNQSKHFLTLRDISFGASFACHDQPFVFQDIHDILQKYPYPELFWSLSSLQALKLRLAMISEMAQFLPSEYPKLLEIFSNIFVSFGRFAFHKDSIVFRDYRHKKSLRHILKSEKSFLKSFSDSYCEFKLKHPRNWNVCILILLNYIEEFLVVSGKQSLHLQRQHIDQIISNNILAYADCLAYDFNSRSYSYTFGNTRESNYNIPIVRRWNSIIEKPHGFDVLRPKSLTFSELPDSKVFSYLDSQSPFASEKNNRIFNCIPDSYWAI